MSLVRKVIDGIAYLSCEAPATLLLIDGPGFEDYTHACAEHEEALKSDWYKETQPLNEPGCICCYLQSGGDKDVDTDADRAADAVLREAGRICAEGEVRP